MLDIAGESVNNASFINSDAGTHFKMHTSRVFWPARYQLVARSGIIGFRVVIYIMIGTHIETPSYLRCHRKGWDNPPGTFSLKHNTTDGSRLRFCASVFAKRCRHFPFHVSRVSPMASEHAFSARHHLEYFFQPAALAMPAPCNPPLMGFASAETVIGRRRKWQQYVK